MKQTIRDMRHADKVNRQSGSEVATIKLRQNIWERCEHPAVEGGGAEEADDTVVVEWVSPEDPARLAVKLLQLFVSCYVSLPADACCACLRVMCSRFCSLHARSNRHGTMRVSMGVRLVLITSASHDVGHVEDLTFIVVCVGLA